MDGLLVIDKPPGPSSHDAVVEMRRLFGERRIGHTGTLDPAATGVLPLVIGRATRLARFLSSGDKSYDAVIRLGMRTTSGDAEGDRMGQEYSGSWPSAETINRALDAFRGTFLQRPPAFSAKKIGGKRSFRLARAAVSQATLARPAPVSVTARTIQVLGVVGQRVTLQLDCSAGFYVRSLADDLGERLGTGAHLESLRRTRSGEFTLADAISLDDAGRDPSTAARRIIPLSGVLTTMSAVVLTAEGVHRAAHGRDLGPSELVLPVRAGPGATQAVDLLPSTAPAVRLLNGKGELVGIAVPASTPGLLHPSVVLM